jgi:putative transcriptional regulator
MQLREVPFVPDVLYEKKMTERNLFAEMTEGFDALAAAREGKKTLLTTEVEIKPAVELSAQEQLRAELNAQAALLIHQIKTA